MDDTCAVTPYSCRMPEQSAERVEQSDSPRGRGRGRPRNFLAGTPSTGSTGSTRRPILFVSTAQWTDEDREDIEFYAVALVLLGQLQRSNFGAQLEGLGGGPVEFGDAEDAMVARIDAMQRATRVHRVLETIGLTEVSVLLAAFCGRAVPEPVHTTFGAELAPLVMSIATPAELQRQENAPRLAADAAVALAKAKAAYVRAARAPRVEAA